MKDKVLACNCGDCVHWEIVQEEDGGKTLKCKTCGKETPVFILTDPAASDHLFWIERTR